MKRSASSERKFDPYLLVTFFAAAVFRFAFYFQLVNYGPRSDDFGPLIYPAYLAGNNWVHYTREANTYYGFGYYWIFTPLFKLIASPKLLHIAIVFVNALLIVLTAVLIYRLCIRYLGFEPGFEAVLAALVPSLFQGAAAGSMGSGSFWYRTDNEIPLYFVCWLLVALLLASDPLRDSKKQRIVKAVLGALLLCFSLTVHERAMALVLTVLFLELFLFLLKRKWLFTPLVFFPVFGAGFAMQRMIRRAVIHVFWDGGWPNKNTSAFSLVSLWFVESKEAVKALLMILIGNLHGILAKSCGLLVFAMVIVFCWVIKSIAALFQKKNAANEQTEKEQTEAAKEPETFVDGGTLLMLTFGVCIVVVVLGLAVRWGSLLYPGIQTGEVVYGYKGISYDRYYYAFMGPVLLGLFAYLKKQNGLSKGLFFGGWGLFLFLEAAALALPIRACYHADLARGDSHYMTRLSGYPVFQNATGRWLMVFTFIGVFAAMGLMTVYVLLKEDKHARFKRLGLPLLMLYMAGLIFVNRYTWMDPAEPSILYGDQGKLADDLEVLSRQDALPDHIFMPHKNSYFVIRWFQPKLDIYGAGPKKGQLKDENLVISLDENNEKLIKADYRLFHLEGFCLYTNCEATIEALEKLTGEEDASPDALPDAA